MSFIARCDGLRWHSCPVRIQIFQLRGIEASCRFHRRSRAESGDRSLQSGLVIYRFGLAPAVSTFKAVQISDAARESLALSIQERCRFRQEM